MFLLRYKVFQLDSWFGFFFCQAVLLVSYLIPNHFPLRAPLVLQPTFFDQFFTVSLWWIIPYMSIYLTPIFTFYLLPKWWRKNFLVVVVFNGLVQSTFYTLFPTTIDRAHYSALFENHWFVPLNWLRDLQYFVDTPNNAFPSQHISLVTVCGLLTLDYFQRQIKSSSRQKKWLKSSRLWGRVIQVIVVLHIVSIFISVFALKQHYAYDVIAGVGVGFFSLFCGYNLIQFWRQKITQTRIQRRLLRLNKNRYLPL